MNRQENRTRRLAAIVFRDIVGYTALMHGDEAVAIALVRAIGRYPERNMNCTMARSFSISAMVR